MLTINDLARPGLEPVNLEISAGEIVAIMGPSGAGKSLLLRAISDLDPNTGMVMLGGRAREAMPAPTWRKEVGYLPAEPGWWAETVGEHFQNWPSQQDSLTTLGMPGDCGDWPISRLSTGERQRLGLVRLLEGAPQVLLLDEPTSGLDADTVESTERLIRDYIGTQRCCLWVTHDDAQAGRMANRCLRIEAGRLAEPTS